MDLRQLSKDKDPTNLDVTLAHWYQASGAGIPSFVIHLLSGKYTNRPIKLDALKGYDRPLVEVVKIACEKSGFILLLANVERKKHGAVRDDETCSLDLDEEDAWANEDLLGSYRVASKRDRYGLRDYDDADLVTEHEIGEAWEETCHLTQVVDAEGRTFTGRIEIDEPTFLQAHYFETEDPDEEEYPANYNSHSGDLVTHWWRPTVMVIVHPVELSSLLDISLFWASSVPEEQALAQNNLYMSIRYLLTKIDLRQINIYRENFTTICKIVVERNTNPQTHTPDFIPAWFCPDLLMGAITLKDSGMCKQIKSAFPSLEELKGDELLIEVQPSLDEFEFEFEGMVDGKALQTNLERDAFLSLVQYPETWFNDTLLPRPPFAVAVQQDTFLDTVRSSSCWFPERDDVEGPRVEAITHEKNVVSQATKRKAEEVADGARSAKRGNGTSV